jgi:hypothetical protein
MKKAPFLAVCALLLFAGIAAAQVVISIAPPPPRREVIPVQPYGHPTWVWRGGYNSWNGQRYIWVPGGYVAPPHRGAIWVSGHYRHTPSGYYWVKGYWR